MTTQVEWEMKISDFNGYRKKYDSKISQIKNTAR